MNKKTLILLVLFIVAAVIFIHPTDAYAQGSTKIALVVDKTECNAGEQVKVTIQGQNVIDMLGLQFTLHYDPNMLELQGEGVNFLGEYKEFGGKTADKAKGILSYPVINQKPSNEKLTSDSIGYVVFKTLKKGPVILKLDNIKAVDSKSSEINYNTQTQAVFNILEGQSSAQEGQSKNSNYVDNNSKAAGSKANVFKGQGIIIGFTALFILVSAFYIIRKKKLV